MTRTSLSQWQMNHVMSSILIQDNYILICFTMYYIVFSNCCTELNFCFSLL